MTRKNRKKESKGRYKGKRREKMTKYKRYIIRTAHIELEKRKRVIMCEEEGIGRRRAICVITEKERGVVQKYGLSRLLLNEKGQLGGIMGVRSGS